MERACQSARPTKQQTKKKPAWRKPCGLFDVHCNASRHVSSTRIRLFKCASREKRQTGGDGGIRTLDPGFGPDAPLAGECLRPLGHVSQTCVTRRSPCNEARILATSPHPVNDNCMTRGENLGLSGSPPRHPADQPITPGPARTPCGVRARPAPCISHRSAPRS